MTPRTVLALTVFSACIGGASPAFAYWSAPVTVEVTLHAAQLAAPTQLRAERDPDDPERLTLHWQAPTDSPVTITGYLVERAQEDERGEPVEGSWTPVIAPTSCNSAGECLIVDVVAVRGLEYRVTAEAGAWRSDPSTALRSAPDPATTAPAPTPTETATGTATDTPAPTLPGTVDPTPLPDPTADQTTDPTTVSGPSQTTEPTVTSTVL